VTSHLFAQTTHVALIPTLSQRHTDLQDKTKIRPGPARSTRQESGPAKPNNRPGPVSVILTYSNPAHTVLVLYVIVFYLNSHNAIDAVFIIYYQTKLELASLSCKSHPSKTANIIFFPQIQRTDASDHTCVSQWPAI